MSNLKAKQLLAEKFNNYYMNNRNNTIATINEIFEEQDDTTVAGSIYNKIFKNQIEMQKLENKYINEGKEIDITKASKQLKKLDADIEKLKNSLNNFTKEYQEELEKLQDEELKNESSMMKRISIINKYNTLSENMENLPTYQNLSSELNDLNVEKFLLEKKIKEYEEENHVLIKEILAQRKKDQVEKYLESKEI
ncbi:MAG: hypothetical protein J6D47_00125 [Peptostreptococcaceae bacterium]|nr:hypothetical protein [Peptostreptococcaceae bacterium]